MFLEFIPAFPLLLPNSTLYHSLFWILKIALLLIPLDWYHITEVFPCEAEQVIITSVSSRELLRCLSQGMTGSQLPFMEVNLRECRGGMEAGETGGRRSLLSPLFLPLFFLC